MKRSADEEVKRANRLCDIFVNKFSQLSLPPTVENLPYVASLMSTEGICSLLEANNVMKRFQSFDVASQGKDGKCRFLWGALFVKKLWDKDARYLKWCEQESVYPVKLVIAADQLMFYPGEVIRWKRRLPAFLQDALFTLFLCLKSLNIEFVYDTRVYLRDILRREWLQILDGKIKV